MLITVDLDQEAVVGVGGTPVSCLSMKRLPTTQDTVQFIRAAQIVAVGAGQETGRFVAKQVGQYAADFIIDSGNWAIQAGPPPQYLFTYSRNTPAIVALFTPITPEATPECPDPVTPPIPQSVTLMGEFRWTDAAGYPHATAPFTVQLDNEVVQGDEPDIVTSLPGFLNWPFISRTAGGVLATDLDAQPTASGRIALGTLVSTTGVTDTATGQLLNAGGLVVWQLQADTGARGYGIVPPLDANAETNNVVWVKVN